MTTIANLNRENLSQSDALDCVVTSYATTRITFDDANSLRKQSDILPGDLGNSILRHCDEQTLTALVAVKETIGRFETAVDSFKDWGVVVSTRYLGRSAFAQALNKFATDGPWNVSVQVVPNRSLHSPASMIGLALGCHGPCVGVGGGLDGETDAWLTATSLLDQQSLPGIWVIFTGWEPDKRIDVEGTPLTDTSCTALALALQPTSSGTGAARLRIAYDPSAPAELDVPAPETAMSRFEDFVAAGSNGSGMKAMLGGGLKIEMNWSTPMPTIIPMPRRSDIARKKAA